MAGFYVYDYGHNYITIEIPKYGDYQWYWVAVYDNFNGSATEQWYQYDSPEDTILVTLTGLQPNRTYTVEVVAASDQNLTAWASLGSVNVTTTEEEINLATVKVTFSTAEIQRIRIEYSGGIYTHLEWLEPGDEIDVLVGSYMVVQEIEFTEGAEPPVYCEQPNGLTVDVMTYTGAWIQREFYIDANGGTYYFSAEPSDINTVPVEFVFDEDVVYRVRVIYDAGGGSEIGPQWVYHEEMIYVQAETDIVITQVQLAAGAVPPVECATPYGTTKTIVDADGNLVEDAFLNVDSYGGTYSFAQGGSGGGDEPDYDGSFVKREVYIGGQKYQAYIGGQKYDVYVAQ